MNRLQGFGLSFKYQPRIESSMRDAPISYPLSLTEKTNASGVTVDFAITRGPSVHIAMGEIVTMKIGEDAFRLMVTVHGMSICAAIARLVLGIAFPASVKWVEATLRVIMT